MKYISRKRDFFLLSQNLFTKTGLTHMILGSGPTFMSQSPVVTK